MTDQARIFVRCGKCEGTLMLRHRDIEADGSVCFQSFRVAGRPPLRQLRCPYCSAAYTSVRRGEEGHWVTRPKSKQSSIFVAQLAVIGGIILIVTAAFYLLG